MLKRLIFLTILVVTSLVWTSEAAAIDTAGIDNSTSNTNGTTNTSSSAAIEKVEECKDIGKLCAGDAAVGDCFFDPERMWDNCRKSCGWCEDCIDQYQNCTKMANEGKCKDPQFKEFMISFCRHSCQQCWYGHVPPPMADEYNRSGTGTSL